LVRDRGCYFEFNGVRLHGAHLDFLQKTERGKFAATEEFFGESKRKSMDKFCNCIKSRCAGYESHSVRESFDKMGKCDLRYARTYCTCTNEISSSRSSCMHRADWRGHKIRIRDGRRIAPAKKTSFPLSRTGTRVPRSSNRDIFLRPTVSPSSAHRFHSCCF
jgi:hypothetical protein